MLTPTKQSFKQSSHRSWALLPSPPSPVLTRETHRLDRKAHIPFGDKDLGSAVCSHSTLEMARPSAMPSACISGLRSPHLCSHPAHTCTQQLPLFLPLSPLSALCLQDTPSQPTNPTSATVLLQASLSSRTCTGFLHPQKGGPLEAHKTNMPLSLTFLIGFSHTCLLQPLTSLSLNGGREGSIPKPPQPSHLSPASGERDKRKEELWVIFHETPRFCTKMQGVLLFAIFFSFLSENNHETIISSHCLFPILFGLAALLGEVVWSH